MLSGAVKTALQQVPFITGSAVVGKPQRIKSWNHILFETPRPKQDVVPIDVVPDSFQEHSAASQMLQHNTYLDNSHTIEVAMKDVRIRISNTADPVLLAHTIQLLQESTC